MSNVQQMNFRPIKSIRSGSVFQELYDSGINFTVTSLGDGGFEVKLGASLNHFDAETILPYWSEVERWMTETATRLYPASRFARTPR